MSKTRVKESKTCKACGSVFNTDRGAATCWKCVNARRKTPCMDCGAVVTRRARRCRKCDANRKERVKLKPGDTRLGAHGYMLEYAPDHPKARGGFRLQHTLVMERHLGRPLQNENVHHKNGVRTDNRLENLELWGKPQPSGARVTDLLAWAREIIAKYEPIEHLLQEEVHGDPDSGIPTAEVVMPIVEGQVVFRNRMGKTTFMKVEQTDKTVVWVWFRRDILGEETYAKIKDLEIFAGINVQVGEPVLSKTGELLLPVEEVRMIIPPDALRVEPVLG